MRTEIRAKNILVHTNKNQQNACGNGLFGQRTHHACASIQATPPNRCETSRNNCANVPRNCWRWCLPIACSPGRKHTTLRSVTNMSTGTARNACWRNSSRITLLTLLRSIARLSIRFGTAIAMRPIVCVFSFSLITTSARPRRAPSRSKDRTSCLSRRCLRRKRFPASKQLMPSRDGFMICAAVGGAKRAISCNLLRA